MKIFTGKSLDFIKQNGSILIFLLSLALGSACAPMQVIDSPIRQQSLASYDQNLKEYQEVIVDEIIKITYKPFPMDYNSSIKKWLYHYSRGKGKEYMTRYLERSGRYLDYMGDILAQNGLPRELVYMSMTESGFWPYATSSANAVGYWQFIKPTGQSYKLAINPYIDERRDFALSTQAAANYLQDLYSVFQDWRLSIAAYNCGEQCVRNAIRKKNSKNFWYLASKKALPPETRDYVPKVIAMARIALEPASYGFYNLKYQRPLNYRIISIKDDSSLSQISNYLKVPYRDIKSLNPKFKTDRVPAGSGSQLRIPSYITI